MFEGIRKLSRAKKIIFAVILFCALIVGGTKPQTGIRLSVLTNVNSLQVTVSVPENLQEKVIGARCQVQIRRNNGAWQTVKEIESFSATSFQVEGNFVGGGKTVRRRLRLYFPTVSIPSQASDLMEGEK